jgi:hypothetical protein
VAHVVPISMIRHMESSSWSVCIAFESTRFTHIKLAALSPQWVHMLPPRYG